MEYFSLPPALAEDLTLRDAHFDTPAAATARPLHAWQPGHRKRATAHGSILNETLYSDDAWC